MIKLPEKCPICRKNMDRGYVTANCPAILWSKEKTLRSTLGTKVIIGRRFGLSNVYAEAYRCPNCKIVLFGYEEKGKP